VGWSYAARTASAGALALLASPLFNPQTGIWAIVSAVVVIQPEVRASFGAAVLRVLANVVGASAGAAVGFFLGGYPVAAIVVGMLLVAGLCRLLRLDAAARSASVSAAIVLLHGSERFLGSVETRVLGVFIGCAIALVVTAVAVGITLARKRFGAPGEAIE
jgi:uncharacterized membrane protein YgaE (UPF0421/DUF939 family)